MSVIGRLDKQVDDHLIKPVKKRRRAGDDPVPPAVPAAGEPPPAEQPAPQKTPERARREEAELPVWLLSRRAGRTADESSKAKRGRCV